MLRFLTPLTYTASFINIAHCKIRRKRDRLSEARESRGAAPTVMLTRYRGTGSICNLPPVVA